MTEPRIVTSQEAQNGRDPIRVTTRDLFEHVRTEPDRIRAAVVKALRDASHRTAWLGQGVAARNLADDADAIENGADYA